MYQKVDTNLNFVDREKKVEEFWKENHIFEKSMENRKKEKPILSTMDRQPPTVTAHRPCAYPCNQGYDSEIPYNERLYGST